MNTASYINFPVWNNAHFDFVKEVWQGNYEKFDDVFEMKPEFKKKVLQSKIDEITKNVENLTLILSEQKQLLEDKKKELKALK